MLPNQLVGFYNLCLFIQRSLDDLSPQPKHVARRRRRSWTGRIKHSPLLRKKTQQRKTCLENFGKLRPEMGGGNWPSKPFNPFKRCELQKNSRCDNNLGHVPCSPSHKPKKKNKVPTVFCHPVPSGFLCHTPDSRNNHPPLFRLVFPVKTHNTPRDFSPRCGG